MVLEINQCGSITTQRLLLIDNTVDRGCKMITHIAKWGKRAKKPGRKGETGQRKQ